MAKFEATVNALCPTIAKAYLQPELVGSSLHVRQWIPGLLGTRWRSEWRKGCGKLTGPYRKAPLNVRGR
jgi:hypothetical protein